MKLTSTLKVIAVSNKLRFPVLYCTITDDAGKSLELENNLQPGSDLLFTFDISFNMDPTPPESTASFANTSANIRKYLKAKNKIAFYIKYEAFGKMLIDEGKIKAVDPIQYDGVTTTVPITFSSGQDYSSISAKTIQKSKTKKVGHYKRVKVNVQGKTVKRRVHYYSNEDGKKVGHYKESHVHIAGKTKIKRTRYTVKKKVYTNLSFKKGVKPSVAIKKIAHESGIKISAMKLAQDKTFKKGYTVSGKPLDAIDKLVKRCKSRMFTDRGQLKIDDLKQSKATHIILDYTSGLLSEPSYSDDSDSGDELYESTSYLLPQIGVRSTYEVRGEFIKKTLIAQNGTYSFDGTQPTMTIDGAVPK